MGDYFPPATTRGRCGNVHHGGLDLSLITVGVCLHCVFVYRPIFPGGRNRWCPSAPPNVDTALLRRIPPHYTPLIHPPNAPFFRPTKLPHRKTGVIGRAAGLAERIVRGGGLVGGLGVCLKQSIDLNCRRPSAAVAATVAAAAAGGVCFHNLGGSPEPHLNKSRAS